MYRIHLTHSNILYATWGAIVSFTQDINSALFGLMICVAADTVTGFLAAPKRKQPRDSLHLKRIVPKVLSYVTAILLAHVLEKLIFPDYGEVLHIQLARIICSVLAWLEVYSTLENLYDITGARVFRILTQLTLKKVSQVTQVDPKDLKH